MKTRVRRAAPAKTNGQPGLLLTAICLLCLLAAVAFMYRSTQMQQAQASAQGEEVHMLPVPAIDIAAGQSLAEAEIVYIRWRGSNVSEYVQDLSEFREYESLVRLSALAAIPKSALKRGGTEINTVVERIPDGMRAITVNVDAESAVEGWAQSGSSVDVLVMRRLDDSDNAIETSVIAENVRILSAGRSTKATPEMPQPPATVTLLVNQADTLRIKTAAHVGKLTFSLRGVGDQQPTAMTHMNQRALLGSDRVLMPKEESFHGEARGPDGSRWVLSDGNRWIREAEPAATGQSVE